jgi:hypothetical protein
VDDPETTNMNAHKDLDTRYLSYMLRMWRKTDGQGQPVWCASLEEPGSHQTARFGDMPSMFAFLQRRLGDTAAQEGSLPGSTDTDGVAGLPGRE